jgi:hypothetical protein
VRRTLLIALLTLAAAALPSSAFAGTASLSGGVFSFTGSPGERNFLHISVDSDCESLGTSPCLDVWDTPGNYLAPPAGCVQQQFLSDSGILCPVPSSLAIDTGDQNDVVMDWNGPSRIDGGQGDDAIFGHGGDDQIKGGVGGDQLIGGAGNDLLDGGDGNDTFEIQAGNADTLETSSPNDSAGADDVKGGSGSDYVSYANRTDSVNVTLDGKADDGASGERDNIEPDVEVVEGGSAGDALTGNAGSNGLYGGPGPDAIRGGAGGDMIDGGNDNDSVFGEQGADTVGGGYGDDVVVGGPGHDNVYGEYALGCARLDSCYGGDDTLQAQDGERDFISCGPGDDRAEIDRGDVVRDIPELTECDHIQAGKVSPAVAIVTSASQEVRMCRALLSGGAGRKCVKRAVKKANARCRRLRPRKNGTACLRAVRRVEKSR